MDLAQPPAAVRAEAMALFNAAADVRVFRHVEARLANRLRKAATPKAVAKLPSDLREHWQDTFDWLSWNMRGFAGWPHDLQCREVASHACAPRGADGYNQYAAAAWLLLGWWDANPGRLVTATKFGTAKQVRAREVPRADGNVYTPSAAVQFLAEELKLMDPKIDKAPGEDGENRSLDAAYCLTRSYLERKKAEFPKVLSQGV